MHWVIIYDIGLELVVNNLPKCVFVNNSYKVLLYLQHGEGSAMTSLLYSAVVG